MIINTLLGSCYEVFSYLLNFLQNPILLTSTSDLFSQPFLTHHNHMVLNGKTERVTSDTLNTNAMFVASRECGSRQ